MAKPKRARASKSRKGKSSRLVIAGVMTGTSCDGLDCAALEFTPDGWRPLWDASVEYPERLRREVFRIQEPKEKSTVHELFSLHRSLGQWYGSTLRKLFRSLASGERPTVVALHGQTVGHYPLDRQGGFTVQLGDPAWVATETGLTVVSQFRHGDMTVGGQGAPFVPLYHQLLSQALDARAEGIAIHNLGGISNFTYLGRGGSILASDTGPASMYIDHAVRRITRGKESFDRGGARALEGEVDWKTVERLLKHPYFRLGIPKSTGRDDFVLPWFDAATKGLSGNALVATATAFTAESIARAYERFILGKKLPLRAIYACGGGAKNDTILQWLRYRLPKTKISTLDEAGFSSQYIESQAFAYLAYRALRGLPNGGDFTGARGFASGGMVTPGANWNAILSSL